MIGNESRTELLKEISAIDAIAKFKGHHGEMWMSDIDLEGLRDTLIVKYGIKTKREGGAFLLRIKGNLSDATIKKFNEWGMEVIKEGSEKYIAVAVEKESDGKIKVIRGGEKVKDLQLEQGDTIRLTFAESSPDRKLVYLATVARLNGNKIAVKPKGENEVWTGKITMEEEIPTIEWDDGDASASISQV